MKIAEVSEQYGLSVDTLRYYERVGLIPPVHRNESGIRDYDELDLRRVDFIKCMRAAGLPVEILIEQRDILAARMEEMQKTLDRLNYKIEVYEKALTKKEKEMLQVEELMAGD